MAVRSRDKLDTNYSEQKKKIFQVKDALQAWTGPLLKGLSPLGRILTSPGTTFLFTGKTCAECFYECKRAGDTFVGGLEKGLENFSCLMTLMVLCKMSNEQK